MLLLSTYKINSVLNPVIANIIFHPQIVFLVKQSITVVSARAMVLLVQAVLLPHLVTITNLLLLMTGLVRSVISVVSVVVMVLHVNRLLLIRIILLLLHRPVHRLLLRPVHRLLLRLVHRLLLRMIQIKY